MSRTFTFGLILSLVGLLAANGHAEGPTPGQLKAREAFKQMGGEIDAAGRVGRFSCHSHLTDDGLTMLPEFPDLTELTIIGDEITDDGLAHLASLQNLKELSLNSRVITGRGMPHLTKLSQLEDLRLYRCEIGDDDMHYLREMPNLRALSLRRQQLTARGLSELQFLPNLRELSFFQLRSWTADDLVPLSRLSGLRKLNLGKVAVNAGQVDAFRRSLPCTAVELTVAEE